MNTEDRNLFLPSFSFTFPIFLFCFINAIFSYIYVHFFIYVIHKMMLPKINENLFFGYFKLQLSHFIWNPKLPPCISENKPWTKEVNWMYIRCSERLMYFEFTSCVHRITVLKNIYKICRKAWVLRVLYYHKVFRTANSHTQSQPFQRTDCFSFSFSFVCLFLSCKTGSKNFNRGSI